MTPDPVSGGRHGRPRVLLVSDEVAWPPVSGYRQRTGQCLRALADVGDVDWIAAPRVAQVDRDTESGSIAPPGVEPLSVEVCPVERRGRAVTARRWLTGTLPWALAAGDWAEADRALASRRGGLYDLIWLMGVDPWLAVDRVGVAAPVMVMDTDVESQKLRSRLAVASGFGLRRGAREAIGRADVRRWQRLEAAASAAMTAVSVCSVEEAELLSGRTWVTPNAALDPGMAPVGFERSRDRLLFVGSLGYAPNLEGVEHFVQWVLPHIRARRPECRLRVVGMGLRPDHHLHQAAGVDVVGRVGDVSAELWQASALVVPVQWGGGTRVKIVEAFAHGTPVVSTAIGAAGLGVRDGREALLADDDTALADACCRILEAPAFGERLAAAGHVLFSRHLDSQRVVEGLAGRIREALDGRA